MVSRPKVCVLSLAGQPIDKINLPNIFSFPIRPDIIQTVHAALLRNRRQPYAVSPRAGCNSAAKSWGTGRAVARIPRVSGGGTARSGQGAYGNMCRGGHNYAPTKIWRRWHRKVNIKLKRYALASALAVSGFPAIVMSRGHKIDRLPEIPLVFEDSLESIIKTSKALAVLRASGADTDLKRVLNTHHTRKGHGKFRNRPTIIKKGPMLVHANDNAMAFGFRNLPGIDVSQLSNLSLLKLAPGGHIGRFIIWTKSAFENLDKIYGSFKILSEKKKKHLVPFSPMTSVNLSRLINSDEIQTIVNPSKSNPKIKHKPFKKYILRNLGTMIKLSPYSANNKQLKKKVENYVKTATSFYHLLSKGKDKKKD